MSQRPAPDSGPPMLVVGHGTRSTAGVAQFLALVERIKRRAGAPGVVAGGFIELAPPPVQDAVRHVVDAGHRHLAAVPLVLAAAGHGKGDIPAALVREQVRHPGLTYRYGRPLGPHPFLQDVLAQRIDAALGLPAGLAPEQRHAARRDVHVVLVGRGSTDPDANAEVAKVSRLLLEGRGYATVETAFVSLAEPGVGAALDRVRRLDAHRIVVAPYFLFPGVLPDRIQEQTAAFGVEHPALDLYVADVIGDCDELADLALERYREALHGDIRMNCDTCAYRVALPGFLDKVGHPQTPHDHPDDPAHPHSHEHAHHSHERAHHTHGDDADRTPPRRSRHHRQPGVGRVSLVGGGPGPDDLLTVRGRRLVDEADVVVVDRLAPQGLLAELPADVLVIDAGKHPRGRAMPQEQINRLLVEHALAGRRVVRLKGGDPFVFGRGHEELEACALAGVPVDVVPGVSSATAVPAVAGVPVTHRGVAHELVVASGHLPPGHPDSRVDWDALGRLSGTLVILMGVAAMPQIARALIAAGRPATTPVMVVENGFDDSCRTFEATLDGIGHVISDESIVPPAVVVVGEVVRRRAVATQLAATVAAAPTAASMAALAAADNQAGSPTAQPAGVAGA